MLSEIHMRQFLSSGGALTAALGALLVGLGSTFRGIASFHGGWKTMTHEWKNGKPKKRLEKVKSIASRTSVYFPFVLGIVLALVGSATLAGRKAVEDTGLPIGDVSELSVDQHYYPYGIMGDVGDVTVEPEDGYVRFVYDVQGKGPHYWDYTYVNGKENSAAARFGGAMYLAPRGNWGSEPDGGYDLSHCHRIIHWEARSPEGTVTVTFHIGGSKRDLTTKEHSIFRYPNTIDQDVATKTLSSEWQSFDQDLSKEKDEEFKRVIGGFGWIVSWAPNGVSLKRDETGPEQEKKFTIDIRNIRYEK